MRKYILLIAALGLLIPATAFADSPSAGETTFNSKCKVCHGPNGDASNAFAKKKSLKALNHPEVQKLTDAKLIEIMKNGKGEMKPVKGLTDQQANDIVQFIRSLAQ